MIDPKLLEILACPACGGELELKDDKIVCVKCGRTYPIKNGIPVLLADQASPAAFLQNARSGASPDGTVGASHSHHHA